MLATVTAYEVGKFIHVLAVVVAFGPIFAFPFFAAIAQTSSPRAVPAVLRGILAVERYLLNPGLLVVLLAGLYTLDKGDISAGESWVAVGFAAIVVFFGMAHGFFKPQTKRALELAERDLAGAEQLSPEFDALTRRISIGGWIATLVLVVTIFFMVAKP
jgi:uncharacterized membrane protein